MVISRENAGKVIIESKFPRAVCRKSVGIYPIQWHFCRYLVHERCNDIKEESKFKCQTCRNQNIGTAED